MITTSERPPYPLHASGIHPNNANSDLESRGGAFPDRNSAEREFNFDFPTRLSPVLFSSHHPATSSTQTRKSEKLCCNALWNSNHLIHKASYKEKIKGQNVQSPVGLPTEKEGGRLGRLKETSRTASYIWKNILRKGSWSLYGLLVYTSTLLVTYSKSLGSWTSGAVLYSFSFSL